MKVNFEIVSSGTYSKTTQYKGEFCLDSFVKEMYFSKEKEEIAYLIAKKDQNILEDLEKYLMEHESNFTVDDEYVYFDCEVACAEKVEVYIPKPCQDCANLPKCTENGYTLGCDRGTMYQKRKDFKDIMNVSEVFGALEDGVFIPFQNLVSEISIGSILIDNNTGDEFVCEHGEVENIAFECMPERAEIKLYFKRKSDDVLFYYKYSKGLGRESRNYHPNDYFKSIK